MTGSEFRDRCELVDGAAAGAWIAERLSQEFGLVGTHVPDGYEAYCRIFHPAWDTGGRPVRWGAVAEQFGTIMHKEAQWESLVGYPPATPASADKTRDCSPINQAPIIGELDKDSLEAFLTIIATQSSLGSGDCYFGLSIIEGWQDHFHDIELKPLLNLPNERRYIVLKGPLSASAWRGARSPNLLWAIDRTWYAISDVDFDSTLFGGDQKMVDAIVGDPRLEAWQVESSDSLASDADMVNGG